MQYGMKKEVKVRKQEIVEEGVQYSRYWGVGHYKQEWDTTSGSVQILKLRKKRRRSGEAAYVVSLQKVQQEKRPACSLQRKVQEYYVERGMPPRGTALEEQGQKTKWEVVTFVKYGRCQYKGTKIQKNWGQGFVSGEQLKNIWYSQCLEAQRQRENLAKERRAVKVKYTQCGQRDMVAKVSKEDKKRILCPEYRMGRKQPWWDQRVVVCPKQGKVQQGSTQTGVPKSVVKGKDKQRNIRKMFKMLREVWLNIGVEKVDMHEGVIVKALLDSGVIEMFMNKKMVAKHRFRLQKLERPVVVRNIDRTNNSGVVRTSSRKKVPHAFQTPKYTTE